MTRAKSVPKRPLASRSVPYYNGCVPKDPDQVIARFHPDVIARLDAAAEKMAADPATAATTGPRGRVTRSAALRRAVLLGLDVLERELGIARTKGKRR